MGVIAIVRTIAHAGEFGAFALVFTLVTAVPSGLLTAGIVGGSVREYVRARNGPQSSKR